MFGGVNTVHGYVICTFHSLNGYHTCFKVTISHYLCLPAFLLRSPTGLCSKMYILSHPRGWFPRNQYFFLSNAECTLGKDIHVSEH